MLKKIIVIGLIGISLPILVHKHIFAESEIFEKFKITEIELIDYLNELAFSEGGQLSISDFNAIKVCIDKIELTTPGYTELDIFDRDLQQLFIEVGMLKDIYVVKLAPELPGPDETLVCLYDPSEASVHIL